jgi:flagellar basal-body rod protein FlgC
MSLLSSMKISASGLAAESRRLEVVASNIANAQTTRTADGGPYRRKTLVFAEVLARSGDSRRASLGGVAVTGVEQDPTPPRMVYNPGHPDADEKGYVAMPNVDIVYEMADLITASRAYEANVTAFNSARSMAAKALEIGKV